MDFNNDGVLDLLLGERDGYFNFYTGNGDGTLHFIGRPVDNAGNPIKRNYNSSGYLDDWNEDGYLDFIAGGYNIEMNTGGVLEVYLNTGESTTSPVWDSTAIDLTQVNNEWRTTQQTCDLNMDGKKDLVFANEGGVVLFAENIGTNSSPAFTNNLVNIACDGGYIYAIDGRARENVTDYNSDGISDILVGSDNGMIYYFKGYTIGINEEALTPFNGFGMTLSEVPTAGIFSVNLTLPEAAQVQISVFDASGRIIESTSVFCQTAIKSVQMNITDSPAGMYIVSVSAQGTTETAKLVKIS